MRVIFYADYKDVATLVNVRSTFPLGLYIYRIYSICAPGVLLIFAEKQG